MTALLRAFPALALYGLLTVIAASAASVAIETARGLLEVV